MVLSVRYGVTDDDIVSESFDGEIVVLDLSCGKYFSFTDAGSAAWEAITSGVEPAALGANGALHDLEAFVRKLLGNRLIVAQPNLPLREPRAELMERLAAAKEKPDFSIFDDLADLFLADPIHDVEPEAGWPEVRQD